MRQYGFMLRGLQETFSELEAAGIPAILLQGDATETVPALAKELNVAAVVSDFSPTRIAVEWKTKVSTTLGEAGIAHVEVDAHNVVPTWFVSNKVEYAARTIRPKIHACLSRFLTPLPPVPSQSSTWDTDVRRHFPPGVHKAEDAHAKIDWAAVWDGLEVDTSVREVDWCKPGPAAGQEVLSDFLDRIRGYNAQRNDPNAGALSNISPYLHFGMLSAQRCILEATNSRTAATASDVDAFVEEALVRRELSDNFCFHNDGYDKLDTLYPAYDNNSWAQRTLAEHADDEREHFYTQDQFDQAETHEDLWNAMQIELRETGKLHGFCRMYWAKKILEWSESPSEALRIAIYLNDRYNLDGRDPNGWVGCAWAIAGVHDQGWRERPIFGKIRYMNLAGCKRKFNVARYIERMSKLVGAK